MELAPSFPENKQQFEVTVTAVAWHKRSQSTESLSQGNIDGHQLVYPVGAKNDSRLFAAAA